MQIDIETRDVHFPTNSSDRLKAKIVRKLGNLAGRIRYLRVTLADENGPKGGKDKICRITARLAKGKQIIVTHKSRTVPLALFRALRRLRRLLPEQRRFARRRPALDLALGVS